MDDGGLSIYAFGIGVANAGLVRLTLFASEMSSASVLGGDGDAADADFYRRDRALSRLCARRNGLFSLFNLANGVLWVVLMVMFLKAQNASGTPCSHIFIPLPVGEGQGEGT